jgi:excisionase family DNA binding protein
MKIESNSKHSVIAERYVDAKAISEYTSLPKGTIYEWAGQGKIPSIKIGRKVLFDLNDIDKMMESMKRTCNKEEKIVNKILGGIHGN